VGDRVTETAQQLGRTPEVQVVDGYERRERRAPPDIPYVRLLKAANPPGVITRAADSAVRSAVEGLKPARVLIDGEEDLLAIIAIDAAPIGSSVYYGQPGTGVVLVTVDERAKSSVGRILTSMGG